MAVGNIFCTGICETENKVYFAFERRGQERGVYLRILDKTGTAVQDVDEANLISATPKVIDSSVYEDALLKNLWVYAARDDSDITISVLTFPVGQTSKMYTGRIIEGSYHACDGGNAKLVNGPLTNFYGFYYHDGTKNKIVQFEEPNTGGGIIVEGH